jgi:hypothetical protein
MISQSKLVRSGIRRAFRGVREGDQRMLLAGAAMAAFGWWRRSSTPTRELLYRRELDDGQSVVVRRTGPGAARLEIRDPDGAGD